MHKLLSASLLIFVFLAATQSVSAYTVVLKNGKVKEGTLLSETEEAYVLQDASGIKMTFKKSTVDLVKTAERNPVQQATPAPEPKPAGPAEKSVSPQAPKPAMQTNVAIPVVKADKSKKSGRVLKEEDLEALRKKYDFGPSSGGEESIPTGETTETETSQDSEERSETDWKSSSDQLRIRVEEAEKLYNAALAQCQSFQNATIQTHVIVDSKTGGEVPMQEATQQACEQAEQARLLLEKARREYQSFLSEARQENVPPGWIRNPDGSDPEMDQ